MIKVIKRFFEFLSIVLYQLGSPDTNLLFAYQILNFAISYREFHD